MALSTPPIGFIGVGLMGHGIASNLLEAGYPLMVKPHRNRARVDDLVTKGARLASGYGALAAQNKLIMFCLSNSEAVEAVVGELEPHLEDGHTLVDMGTSRPQSNRAIAQRLAKKGVCFAEAPLAGGPAQAKAGELGALVGAAPDVFERILPVLEVFCSRISHIGDVGDGQTAKLINNYLVCGMIALIAESYNGARKAGISWRKLYDVMQCGSNNSRALQNIIGPALDGDYDGYRFSIANAAKDMDYYRGIADEIAIESKLSQSVAEVFATAVAAGEGDKMVSRLVEPAPGNGPDLPC